MNWLFACIAILAIGGLVVLSLPRTAHQIQNQYKPHSNNDPANPDTKKEGAQKSDSGTDVQKQQNYWECFVAFVETHDKFIVATSTIVIAAFTLALFVATYLLWTAGEYHSARQLRAYVFIDKASVVLDGRTLRGVIELKNSGQTPAYDLTVKSRLQTGEIGKPFNPAELEEIIAPRAILAPGGIVEPRSDLVIPDNNTLAIPAFKEGRGVIYFLGQAEYRDTFGNVWVLDIRLRSYGFDAAGNRWILQPTEIGNTERQK